MYVHSVVYDPRDGYPLHLTAKRYRLAESGDRDVEDSGALTLIFLHSTSFHKETWEPTIVRSDLFPVDLPTTRDIIQERIFELVATDKNKNVKIHEAWAIECPNHGASAELNELALQKPEYFHSCMLCLLFRLGIVRLIHQSYL